VPPLFFPTSVIIIFSGAVNLLTLSTSVYMLQVFDRVLAGRSWSTLVYLTLITLAALAALGALDTLRAQLLSRLADWGERRLAPHLLRLTMRAALDGRPYGGDAFRDLGRVREAISGTGALAILDAPWAPIYLALLYVLHPVLGWIGVGGALVLLAVAIAGEWLQRAPSRSIHSAQTAATRTAEQIRRNAETVEAMGMTETLVNRWAHTWSSALEGQRTALDRAAVLGGLSKALRYSLQVLVLGAGAWLVVREEISAGATIAASIVMSRALAPVDIAIGAWKQIIAAREAWRRLRRFLAQAPTQRQDGVALPRPTGHLRVEDVVFAFPGARRPILSGVAFEVLAGQTAALIGPSGAGKSTLARLIVGVHTPQGGRIRLDGADVSQWPRERFGAFIGYLPQDIELFAGTVAENIARMGKPVDDLVLKAARRADVHDMILRLPEGYETQVGEGGRALSGGQRQRIGLARAFYGNPALLVLDEPNANLDTAGEDALLRGLAEAKAEGATIIIVTHRLNILDLADVVVLLAEGAVAMAGPRREIVARLARRYPERKHIEKGKSDGEAAVPATGAGP
jgi:PrtD family type I secretion system ABC transporter